MPKNNIRFHLPARWISRGLFGWSVLIMIAMLLWAIARHLQDGQTNVMAVFWAGITLALILWRWSGRTTGPETGSRLCGRIAFCLTGGLALYGNVAYALWAAGVPLKLGIIQDGQMGQHFWLGPVTLLYAASCWAVLKWNSRGVKPGEK